MATFFRRPPYRKRRAFLATSRAAAVANITGTGALVAGAAIIAGTGLSVSTGTGAAVAQNADLDGAGLVATPNAWNAADKSANITLSNNDKTATLSAAVTSGVRSTTKHPNGSGTDKYYAEFLLNNVVGSISTQVGIRDVTQTITSSVGSTAQVASNSGNIVTSNTPVIGNIGGSPLVDGDIICMAWSPATERIWFRKNNNLWNNDAAANPETNTNGLDISVLNNTDHALWFLIASGGNGAITTIRTEAAEFTCATPSGFTSWMGEALVGAPVTGTGALAAQAAAVSGEGVSTSVATGALVAEAATASGTGVSVSAGSGALVAGAAAVGGEGVSGSIGSGAPAAQAAVISGEGVSSSAGSGALAAQAATVAGTIELVEGISGSGALVATAAGVLGTGEVAETITGTGALAAAAATVAGLGVSSSTGSGAVNDSAATVTGAGLSETTGTGALVCGSATLEGVGIVVEEGAAFGDGALVAGAATVDGVGEVTGEVVQAPIGGGYYRPPQLRPYPVEGHGYGILPELEGEAHGVVVVAGVGAGTLPGLSGLSGGSVGVAGRSSAQLHIKAAAIGVRGQVGAAAAVLERLSASGLGTAGSRGSGAGVLVTLKAAARGRHDDDEAAMVAFLLAA